MEKTLAEATDYRNYKSLPNVSKLRVILNVEVTRKAIILNYIRRTYEEKMWQATVTPGATLNVNYIMVLQYIFIYHWNYCNYGMVMYICRFLIFLYMCTL